MLYRMIVTATWLTIVTVQQFGYSIGINLEPYCFISGSTIGDGEREKELELEKRTILGNLLCVSIVYNCNIE